jgi:hypothetical protein
VIAALLIAVVAQSQPPARDTRPPASVDAAAIVGTVTSDAAQPVPLRRARVTLNSMSLQAPRTVITRDDGSFVFEGLPAGSFTVSTAKEGFVPTGYDAGRTALARHSVLLAERQRLTLTLRLRRGAVITGAVTDVDGLPAQGVAVTALVHRFVGMQGERRYMAPTLTANVVTDDRGIYRIYGLPAGEYVVAAQPQARNVGLGGTPVRLMAGGVPSTASHVMAQVFHPGATDIAQASRVSVRAGEERGSIDMQLQYVPLATVSGTLAMGTGAARVLWIARTDDALNVDQVRAASVDPDGRFTFGAIPPGQYRIVGRSSIGTPANPGSQQAAPSATPQFAMADVFVAGEDVAGIALSMQPGIGISGQIVFEGEKPPAGLPVSLQVPVPARLTIANPGAGAPAVQIDGTRFRIEGIIPGTYRLTGNTMQGIRTPIGPWWLKSLVVGGRDILDAPLDLRTSADDAVATFSDRASELSGAVTDAQGAPIAGIFVVAVTTDRSAWFFNSRRVVGVRTDRDGRYAIRNLPPGDYRVIAAADLEQNEWFDPPVLDRLAPTATPIAIAGVEKRTVDLTVR